MRPASASGHQTTAQRCANRDFAHRDPLAASPSRALAQEFTFSRRLSVDTSSTHFIWYLFAFATTAGCGILLTKHYGRFDVFAPGIQILILFGLGYLLPYMSFVNGIDAFSEYWPIDLHAFEDSIVGALKVLSISVVSLTIGVLLGGGAKRGTTLKSNAFPAAPLPRTVTAFWVILCSLSALLFWVGVMRLGGWSILATGLGDRTRLFEGLNYFFLPTVSFVSASLFFAHRWAIAQRSHAHKQAARIDAIASMLLLCVGAMFAAALGSKSTIFVAVASIVVLLHLTWRAIPLWVVAVAAALGLPLLMAYQLFVREYLVEGYFPSLSGDSTLKSFAAYVVSEFEKNFMQLQTLTILVDRMPSDLEFQNGMTLASLVTLPIPSSVMPDKLLPAPGVFTLAFWPDRWLKEGTTLPPGILGELYMNFGVAGVTVGSLLGAMGLERLYWLARACPESALKITGYSAVVGSLLHAVRGDIAAPTLLVALILVPVLIAAKIKPIGRA